MLRLLSAVSWCIFISAAAAENADDEKRLVADAVAPAIARLNYADFHSRASCTAAQLGARTALTAAGCVANKPMASIHLLFGFARGEWTSHRQIEAVIDNPTPNGLVLLCLNGEIGEPPQRMGQLPTIGMSLWVASYRLPRAFALNVDSCEVSDVEGDAITADCMLSPGVGGGGAFALIDGIPHLAGIVTRLADGNVVIQRWSGPDPDELCRGV